MLKTAVFAPMPSASVSTLTAANPGLFLRVRNPYRRSAPKVSIQFTRRSSRHSSFTCSTPPNSRNAVRRASSRDIPAATFSVICRSK